MNVLPAKILRNKKGKYLPLFLIALFLISSFSTSAKLLPYSGEFAYRQNYLSEPYLIGELEFESGSPQYSCGNIGQERVSVGVPRNDCWHTEFSFAGKSFSIGSGESVILNRFLKVTYSGSGFVTYDNEVQGTFKKPWDWANTFTFEWLESPLSISAAEDFVLARLGEERIVKVLVNNRLTVFSGSFLTFTEYELLQERVADEISGKIEDFSLRIPTDILGNSATTIFAKVRIGNAVFVETEPATVNFRVIPNIQAIPDTSTSCVSNQDCPEGFACQQYSSGQDSRGICSKPKQKVTYIQVINQKESFPIGVVVAAAVAILVAFSFLRGKKDG